MFIDSKNISKIHQCLTKVFTIHIAQIEYTNIAIIAVDLKQKSHMNISDRIRMLLTLFYIEAMIFGVISFSADHS